MADTPVFISGLRGTESFSSNERPKNFRETILWLDPNGMTPLTALSAKMKTESTDDPEFSWWEERLVPKRATISNAAAQAGAFTLVNTGVTNPAYQYKVGDILQITSVNALNQPASGAAGYGVPGATVGATSQEICRVLSIVDDDQITVTRNIGGLSAAVTITANSHQVTLIGSSFEEGSASPEMRSNNPTLTSNYTQIFKTAFGQTNTSMNTKYRTGDAFNNDRKRAMFTHSEQLEQAAIWGIKSQDLSGAGPRRTTSGLRALLTSNVSIESTAITNSYFLDRMTPLFDFNAGGAGDERIVFLGNGALNAIQKKMTDPAAGFRMNYEGEVKFYGLNLLKVKIPQGTFYLKTHPLFNQDPVYTKSMLVINGKGIIRRPLKSRDTKIQSNIQNNDVDMRKDQWLTEMGIEVQFERTMGYYGNISAT